MEETHRISAARLRERLAAAPPEPAAFREALGAVPPADRDAWLDLVLGIDGVAEDGPDLPAGCVPYLPCAVETLLEMIDGAAIISSDVFVDVGAGVGRAAALVHLATGAAVIGIEIQAGLHQRARGLAQLLGSVRFSMVEGDAVERIGELTSGTVFLLYCPFGGERLVRALGGLEAIARTHAIRVCTVDLPPLSCPWLPPVAPSNGALAIYRS